MKDYVIFSDSGCDIEQELLDKWGVGLIDLTFHTDSDATEYRQSEMPIAEFYDRMTAGTVFKTSAANENAVRDGFIPKLKEGLDILYICFSSGLSGTAGTAKVTVEQLLKEFPERRITVIDTLCASAGEGLMLYYAVKAKEAGLDMDTVAAGVYEKLPHLCHWFTVDDLVYLKRGGRVGAVAAFFGGVLNIKPVLHVDDEGHLIPVVKVRGRMNSIKGLAKRYRETALDPAHGEYFISHGACLEDAKKLESMIEAEFGNKATHISDIGPVIGAHSGPGTLALFFLGKQR